MTSIPTTMKALVIEEQGKAVIKDHPVPTIAEDEVLIKTAAVALNPTDWKHIYGAHVVVGSVVGCDASGVVVQVGKNVTTLKAGDKVTHMTHGSAFTELGAFAEYVKAPADLTWVIPENTLSFEEAASFGVAFLTAVQVFYNPKFLDIVEPPAKVSGEEWLLIYGGSSSVGQYAIQLAHLAGYKVVSTASPRNHALVKDFGADVVFDYRDPDVVAKIKAATGDSITRVLDTISEEDTQRICAAAIAPAGGKLNLILPPKPSSIARSDIKVTSSLLYSSTGRPLNFGPVHIPAAPEDRVQIAAFLKKVPQLVTERSVKPITIKRWEGGLPMIVDALQYLREGKASAEKIVLRL
ncbi:GroES-like protein [Epithele typhae]|uniref:GroES-like protein n=1 Tax=Epithele typhae TaxID=378194 RepID=UPI00200811EB|nr:GroES-like protein [Epithele typhae]KAH9928547.1 GroES-like protein [Epithele typhae]